MKGRKAMLLHGQYPIVSWLVNNTDRQQDERIPTSCKVADVHEMLIELDESEKESAVHKTYEVGPFSVFSADHVRSNSSGSTARDICINSERTIVETIMHREDSDSSDPVSFDAEVCFGMAFEYSAEPLSRDTEIVDQTSAVSSRDFSMQHLLDLELRTHFFSDKTTRELMYNYINVVADLLQPASHSQNPYKTIYVPTALIGSADRLCSIGMADASHSNVAVFHAILSVSAFHLRGTENLPERTIFDKLGRLHRGKAFEFLQKALLNDLDRSDHQAAISAMMSLVSSDVSVTSFSDDY